MTQKPLKFLKLYEQKYKKLAKSGFRSTRIQHRRKTQASQGKHAKLVDIASFHFVKPRKNHFGTEVALISTE